MHRGTHRMRVLAREGEEVLGTCLEGSQSVYLHTPERRSLSRDRAVH